MISTFPKSDFCTCVISYNKIIFLVEVSGYGALIPNMDRDMHKLT